MTQNDDCFAHEIGSDCECEYCLENPDCDPNNKGKTCRDNFEHSEMCAECILLSGKPRYSTLSKLCEDFEEDVEVRCICSTCNYEGKCYVNKKRAEELKEHDLMEENCFNSDCEEYQE